MKRLIEIATGRPCGDYPDEYQPPANSVDADPALYRFDPVPQEEIDATASLARRRVILSLLAGIDRCSIRPLREGDSVRIAALEAEAEVLRVELRGLQ